MVLMFTQTGQLKIGPVDNQTMLKPVTEWFIKMCCIKRAGTPIQFLAVMRRGQV
jgi:hypothetical protein